MIAQQPAGIDATKSLGHLTPAQAAEGKETVTTSFPVPVLLTIAHGNAVHYPVGTHEVPSQWSDHWWLRVNGAAPVVVADTRPADKAPKKR